MEIEGSLSNEQMLTKKLDELIAAVLDSKIRTEVCLDKTLWNTSQVAEYLGLSYKYTHEHIIDHHTFPNAIRLKFNKQKKGHPRWYAGEVIEWVKAFRD